MMAGAFALLICVPLIGQEFWIQPANTHVLAGQRVPLEIKIGQNFSGEKWKGKGNRIVSYRHYRHNEAEENLLSLVPGDNIVTLPEFIPAEEGTHMLTLCTNPKFFEISADAFNDYLKEDGLMDAYRYRVVNNQKFSKGREKVLRCAKVLIQAGDETDNTYKAKTNLLLDIVPEKNPYDHARDQGLTFRVLYEGTPLPDAMVKWWHKDHNSVQTDFLYTSSKGEVTFSAAEPGLYMISVVHMIHLDNDPSADWQSVKSSLVFGIEE